MIKLYLAHTKYICATNQLIHKKFLYLDTFSHFCFRVRAPEFQNRTGSSNNPRILLTSHATRQNGTILRPEDLSRDTETDTQKTGLSRSKRDCPVQNGTYGHFNYDSIKPLTECLRLCQFFFVGVTLF